jgi:SAM-dependent methyltransferase
MESLIADSRNPYQGAAVAWARGPAVMYDRLASMAIARVAGSLRGTWVVDVGAGTGALSRALRTVGAIPVAVDTSSDMLSLIGDTAVSPVVGDMCALPFVDARFDAAVSGFAISHIDTPEQALIEMRRVVRPRGYVIAAVFGKAPDGASKDAVDEVAADFGFEPPAWYIGLKTRTEPLSNTPALLAERAGFAGLQGVEVADVIADSGLDTPESITAYRTGLAHIAPFVESLSQAQRTEFFECAVAAVRERGQPVRPRVLILSSRVPA